MGKVYILKEQGTDKYKIGWTECSPEYRIKGLQTGNPRKLEIVALIDGGRDEEKELHRLLAETRIGAGGGEEWFDSSDLLLSIIDVKRIPKKETLKIENGGSILVPAPKDENEAKQKSVLADKNKQNFGF